MRLQLGEIDCDAKVNQLFAFINCRTASDLEEIGMIDKYQKGYIKDLIISGDSTFQAILEKYEKGDKKELEGNAELCCIASSLI